MLLLRSLMLQLISMFVLVSILKKRIRWCVEWLLYPMVLVSRFGYWYCVPRIKKMKPKSGTVTTEIGKAVQEVKGGKIDFKVDRFGIKHTTIGKMSFTSEKIADNAREFL